MEVHGLRRCRFEIDDDRRRANDGLRRCRFEIDDDRRRTTTAFDDGSELVAARVMDPENVARARSLDVGIAGVLEAP